ncbi:RNA guanine-7 methyltransferase [Arctopsyche grandis]|uniref:RNA guanine-7 methyltransferase n=1 Tax=Arctopsyche grandis TaxID=121162 RepID=UPI00406D9A33
MADLAPPECAPPECEPPEKATKTSPPETETEAAVVAEHYNNRVACSFGARRTSPIFYLRNFNNWVKSMVIQKGADLAGSGRRPLAALDLCCGKGGDLFKWRAAAVSRLVCTDIAATSVSECERKWRQLRVNGCRAYFIVADAAGERLKTKLPRDPLDLVSCQFALHYSFGSSARALRFLRNAAEALRPGGIFIGSIPDAEQVVSRIKANKGAFGNDIYKVEPLFDWSKGFPLFGAKYDFHLEGVVDCPEYLVYFPLLVELAKKFDFELVFKKNFKDFYEEKNKEGKELLTKMESLETVHRKDNDSLGDKYQHAIDYFKNNESINSLGTMSQQEWEVASMYCVFAFQKKE